MSDNSKIALYVDASLALHGLALDGAQRERVLAAFTMMHAVAAPLLDYALPAEVEPAPVFTA